ncbi:metal ABC transporter solute-binding protein, Zn/Mn family [Mobiluncus mulieris]|uniref:metal ABC transporter solute-binding protein, Zn/Mn family n=1 Tax=Mobiluncus mulieris TaxID=2052 RepID=UPI0020924304|nr:zinc ABC transporter substrate-binding protein [Mobiluncus mulieris]
MTRCTNCNDYKANADKYAADIEKVGEDINTTLSSLDPKQRTLVSCEGAFSYLTRDIT